MEEEKKEDVPLTPEEEKREIMSSEDLDTLEGYGYPSDTKDSIFRFFREILGLTDDTKVGFLNNTDLHNARVYQDIADYAEAESWDMVAAYCRSKGEVILATSMSRDGFFLKTAVTQIRQVNKAKEGEKKKTGFWQKKEESQ